MTDKQYRFFVACCVAVMTGAYLAWVTESMQTSKELRQAAGKLRDVADKRPSMAAHAAN